MRDVAGLHFRLAVLYAIVGLGLGNVMGALHDFSMLPVHAHLNLLGWVSVTLYGLYLRLHPTTAVTRLARIHFFVAHGGFLAFVTALVIITQSEGERGVPLAAAGGVVSLLGMILFATLVFRTRPNPTLNV